MGEVNFRRGLTTAFVLLGLLVGGAVVWGMLSPNSYYAKITGFVAFGVLCILLRAIPRKFLIPKPTK